MCPLIQNQEDIREVLTPQGEFFFPRVFPGRGFPLGNYAIQDFERIITSEDIVMTPDRYLLNWEGGDLSFYSEIKQGNGMMVTLYDIQGKELAKAATAELAEANQIPWVDGQLKSPNKILLSKKQLPEGQYIISFNQGQLNTFFSYDISQK